MNRLLPVFIKLPEPPRGSTDSNYISNWIRDTLFVFLANLYRSLADRSEEVIQEGTLAQRPAAIGRRRFYYATDTDDLYYDKGSWMKVGHGV
jgi:hypothetical protein